MERKHLFPIVGILVAVTVAALFLAAVSPVPSAPLKQNLYKRTFDDLQGLLSLDVVIHYETEADGTWRRSNAARYNVTVLVKPTYVKESVISKVNVIRWGVGGIHSTSVAPTWGGWANLAEEPAPIDYGLELMGFWLNQSAWRVVSQVYQVDWPDYTPRTAQSDPKTLFFWFVIREILTNGTSRISNWGDYLSIDWAG